MANVRSAPASESTRSAIESLTMSEHQLHSEIVSAARDPGSRNAFVSADLEVAAGRPAGAACRAT